MRGEVSRPREGGARGPGLSAEWGGASVWEDVPEGTAGGGDGRATERVCRMPPSWARTAAKTVSSASCALCHSLL